MDCHLGIGESAQVMYHVEIRSSLNHVSKVDHHFYELRSSVNTVFLSHAIHVVEV